MKTLKLEVGWFIHNMIGHPLFGLIHFLGGGWYFPRVERFAQWIHDATVPACSSPAVGVLGGSLPQEPEHEYW